MSDTEEQPLVCRLSETEKDQRRPQVEELFVDQLRAYRETDDGFLFEFEASDANYEGIFEFVDAERKCCPFFQFEITVEPDGGPISLEIGGSDRVKRYVEQEMITEIERIRSA